MIKKIKHFFLCLFSKRYRTITEINEKLSDAVVEQYTDKLSLMRAIVRYIDKLRPPGRSKYIPLSIKEKSEIRAHIEVLYGDQMRDLRVKMNRDLKFT